MKCPNCGDRTEIELDMHSSGFTAAESPIKECGVCGLVWRIKNVNGETVVDIVKPATKKD